MLTNRRIMPWLLRPAAASLVLFATLALAQTRPVPAAPAAKPVPAAPPAPTLVPAPPPSEKDLAVTQRELIRLLRLSPTLTTVIAHDPSLLANPDYVARNNPQLAQFLAGHPEIVRNPEFYLFTHANPEDGGPDEALERAVWPEYVQPRQSADPFGEFMHDLSPLLAFACFLGALIWMIRVFVENRRWSRIFKLQSEVHGKLIDKFSDSHELASYMGTEAGKRFLEAAPIPVSFEQEQRMPNAVARVLTPLQVGIVLVLLGVGFFLLRHVNVEARTPMLILGTVTLMPGLGFILSAGITWLLASRLGLMPENPAKPEAPFDPQERQ